MKTAVLSMILAAFCFTFYVGYKTKNEAFVLAGGAAIALGLILNIFLFVSRNQGRGVLNLPNALTLSRIFIVPLLVVVLLTPFSENWFGVQRHLLGVALFLGAAFTDYLDGRIARSRRQVSRFGILLDPIADKLLISAALISLVENRLAPAWAVCIIVGREFAVSGLRSVAAADGVVISASRMGKFKMASQVLAVALLIASSTGGEPPVANFGRAFPAIQFWTVPELHAALEHLFGGGVTGTDWQVLLYTAGRAMLWVVVLSACASMYEYFRAFYQAGVGRPAAERDAGGAPLPHPRPVRTTTPNR